MPAMLIKSCFAAWRKAARWNSLSKTASWNIISDRTETSGGSFADFVEKGLLEAGMIICF